MLIRAWSRLYLWSGHKIGDPGVGSPTFSLVVCHPPKITMAMTPKVIIYFPENMEKRAMGMVTLSKPPFFWSEEREGAPSLGKQLQMMGTKTPESTIVTIQKVNMIAICCIKTIFARPRTRKPTASVATAAALGTIIERMALYAAAWRGRTSPPLA